MKNVLTIEPPAFCRHGRPIFVFGFTNLLPIFRTDPTVKVDCVCPNTRYRTNGHLAYLSLPQSLWQYDTRLLRFDIQASTIVSFCSSVWVVRTGLIGREQMYLTLAVGLRLLMQLSYGNLPVFHVILQHEKSSSSSRWGYGFGKPCRSLMVGASPAVWSSWRLFRFRRGEELKSR